MAQFIQNILWNSVEGFVEAGKKTAGEYAGNALIKAGDVIENGGRSVGNGIERRATQYGSSLSGQTYKPSPKALPSTARKPAIKRSNSVPASNKPMGGKSIAAPTSKVPLGANKYPGGKSASTAGKSPVSSIAGAGKPAVRSATKQLPKPYPNNVPYGTKITPQSTQKSAQYPQSKPSGTPVKPGAPKPFSAPTAAKSLSSMKPVDGAKPYPGTSTLPGQASRTPIKPKKYTPAPRLGSQVKKGEKMMHIAV